MPLDSSYGYNYTYNHGSSHTEGAADPVITRLLGLSHSDTTPGVPVLGDIIIALTSSPKWGRYALIVPAANVRNALGVDNGETVPTWKTTLDSTAPTTIGVADAAAAGTSLIYSHRDHRHGSPATYTPTPHNILSASHADSTTGTVADGDVIIGDVTPSWSRLARSVPGSAGLLNTLGMVNGETRPSWKAAEHNLLSARHSDTLADSVVRGDVIYGNSTPAWARLAKPATPALLTNDATDVAWDTMAWTTPTFNAAIFTASTGTWTVAAGDVITFAYRLIGKTMLISFYLGTTDVSATPSSLIFTLPASKTASKGMLNPCYVVDNNVAATGLAQVVASGTQVIITRQDGTNFAISTAQTAVAGQLVLETA